MNEIKSKEKLFLQGVWKRALRSNVEFTFKTKAGAMRARLSLYNAVKRAKDGGDVDPEVNRAAQEIEITWTGETSIMLRKKIESDYLKTMMDTLGDSPAEHEDPAILESVRKALEVQEQVNAGLSTGHKPNKFYDRSK